MKKKDLERQRNISRNNSPSHLNTTLSTQNLRIRVSADLSVVRDAYDIGAQALTELSKLLPNVAHSDRPTRELTELAKSFEAITRALIALRGEGRETIKEHVAQNLHEQAGAQMGGAEIASPAISVPVTPLAAPSVGSSLAVSHSPKISPIPREPGDEE